MNYRTDKYGNPLSILGFGCMRFQRKLGIIDFDEAEREIMTAFRSGVNYYDTAYIYPGSEVLLGEILEKNGIRRQVNIATKLPLGRVTTRASMDKLFNEQLKHLRTDYIDYYLMHNLSDWATWERLKKLGVEEWIAEKKASGAIRQVGFSYHGNSELFCRLLDDYDWDFCQIQYNYLDEHTQAGRKGLRHAHEKGIPVVIMEPLRGGKLVNTLPEEAKRIIAEYPVKHTPAQWAFRWLWNQPEVTVVLSGMNSEAMVRDNIETASSVEVGELGPEEEAMLASVAKAIRAKLKVGCTACGYCMPCPQGLNIPGTFAAYNRYHGGSKLGGLRNYLKYPVPASACIGCGKCEKHCPQGIEIRKELKQASRDLEGPVFKLCKALSPKAKGEKR